MSYKKYQSHRIDHFQLINLELAILKTLHKSKKMYNTLQQQQQCLDNFIKENADFTFQERFFKWESYLKKLQSQQSQFYSVILEKFVEMYPFNHTYWTILANEAMKVPKGKANALRLYQMGLAKNPRCITLWKQYLDWLRGAIYKTDPNYLKNEYDKATKIIGSHYKAAFIFEGYFELEQSPLKKFQALKKALVSPLQEIDKIYDLIVTYIDTSQDLSEEVLLALSEEEGVEIQATPYGNNSTLLTEEKQINERTLWINSVKEKLKQSMRRLYEPTKKHVELRYQYEIKLANIVDEYQPYLSNIETWRNYIACIKNTGNSQFVLPIYERALIVHCDNESLWEQYFSILESEGNYNRALYLLRSHSTFFRNFSREITYYWLQLEERESPIRARQLYLELEKNQYYLETFIRHIQLELRSKDYNNAKWIYQTILTVFTANLNIISYVVLEYAEFSLKYFREIQFPKKLLKTYFDSYLFSEYLFLGYLQFFIKHIQYKEGSKEGKEIYDQFLNVILDGLKRTQENCPEKYHQISQIVQKHLRNYITSIFLIKGAERKIKEFELNVKKQANFMKRRLIEDRDQSESKSLRKKFETTL